MRRSITLVVIGSTCLYACQGIGATEETLNLRRSVTRTYAGENLIAAKVKESDQGEDLNNDGDLSDEVIHTYGPVIRNVGLAAGSFAIGDAKGFLLFGVLEQAQGTLA